MMGDRSTEYRRSARSLQSGESGVCGAGQAGDVRRAGGAAPMITRLTSGALFAAVLAACLAASGPSAAQETAIDRELFSRGLVLYVDNCAVCHGENGDGRGPLATGFTPRPRNLTIGVFKFSSTEAGEFVARADLFETIRNGVEGSYGRTMPRFDHLSEDDLAALAEVVRVASDAPRFGVPLVPPPRPETADIAGGETLYRELNCVGCHGENGDGSDVLADNLFDSEGLSIRPADFRVGQFKGGNEPEDIWMRLYTGMDGTPMPTFGGSASGEDLWALVEYVLNFSNSGS
ncbi:MAG: c-type cytochrome [Pseudomonadota bacterium]